MMKNWHFLNKDNVEVMSEDDDENVVILVDAWHSTFWSAFPSSCSLPSLWPLLPLHFLHSVVKMIITLMMMITMINCIQLL